MPVDLKEFQRLKENVDRLTRESSKAEGALEQQMTRLKTEFGCETIEAAKKKSRRLTTEAEEAETSFDTAMAEFKEKWQTVVG